MTVIKFKGITKLDIDAHDMLKNIAEDPSIEKVIVIAVGKESTTYHSSFGSRCEVVYNLDLMKHRILNGELG